MIRRALPVLLLCLLLVPASAADAAQSAKKAIWGPVEVDGESQFPIYKDLGAGVYQTLLEWDKVAVDEPMEAKDPEDPGYDWPAELDTAIDEGKRNGIAVAFTVTGMPRWAKPRDFKAFVTAAAKRFPAVRTWSIGEGRAKPASAYPQLLDGAYAALKAAGRKNRVIGGNGNTRLKLANGKAARMDLFGYDPSARRAPTKAQLAKVGQAAGSHKLWLGPVHLPTSAGGAFRLTRAQQASWLKTAFKLVKADTRIAALSYRTLRDEPGAAFTGLIGTDGAKKPAYTAFKKG